VGSKLLFCNCICFSMLNFIQSNGALLQFVSDSMLCWELRSKSGIINSYNLLKCGLRRNSSWFFALWWFFGLWLYGLFFMFMSFRVISFTGFGGLRLWLYWSDNNL
jgi:hypothetical protein